MKRMILGVSVVAAMLLTASAALADGVSMRWANCIGDAGTASRTSACTSNLGNAGIAIGTFTLSADAVGVTGIELIVDIITADAVMPAWWQMATANPSIGQTTGCRSGKVTMNPTIAATAANCFDWASGAAAGGLAAYNPNPAGRGTNTARILGGFAVPAAAAATIPANTEMFAFNLVISNLLTTGTGSCAGCTSNACLVFNNVKMALGTTAGPNFGTPNVAGSNIITWQGTGANCSAVPTRNATWSGVKSLYR